MLQMNFKFPKAIVFATIATFGVAACTTPPPVKRANPEQVQSALKTCDKSKACAVALLTAEEINRQKGRSFGHGVKRRGAKADDDTLIVGIDVPQVIATIPPRGGKPVKTELRDRFVSSMCKSKNMPLFFEAGGQVRLITYLPSGKVFSDQTTSSCS